MTEKIMLLDGHSLLNRAFYGLPDLTNAKGQHTNAVLGFLNMMIRYIEEEQPTHLLVAFDRKEPTFRHLRYDGYKGTRKPMPQELHEQVAIMKDVLTSMEIPIVTQAGIEADDILGTIGFTAQEKGYEVSIISGDRDLLQLATDHIKIKIPKTKAGGTITEEYYAKDVEALYGVTPKEFIDMKGLMGDTSDNIPGVPGIGEKTAGKIIKEYHSIEEAYAHIEEVKPTKAKNNLKEYYDQAILSKELATIKIDCDLEYHFEDAKISHLFNENSYLMFKELELKSLFKYFDESEKKEEQLKITLVSDLLEAEQWKDTLIHANQVGFSYIGARQMIHGVSYTTDSETVLITPGGFLTLDCIQDMVLEILQAGTLFKVLDYKAMLHTDARLRDYEDQMQDTGLQAYLLNPLQATYDYDDLSRDYCGKILPARKELLGKKSLEEAFDLVDEKAVQLAGFLSYVPYKAAKALDDQLVEEGMMTLYKEIELPTVATLYDMEHYGITVEKDALKQYGEQLTGRIEELEKNIYEQAGKKFNINSPKQLGVILFEDLKMPLAKKTKTGYSTSADILEKLAPDYPVVSDILEYRQLTKLKSTYAEGLYPYIEEDGKIHTVLNQKVTATGRLSSSEPNLQNIPIRMELGRAIRKVFIPDPGFVFISADYSQIELRVLAHMANDQNLIAAYQKNQDIHTATASQVFDIPIEEVTPLHRRNAKAVNFGIVYGISAFGLSQDLNITRKEAGDYIDKYFMTYPGIKTYLDGNISEAKKTGIVKTLYGRIRPIPELSSSNFMQRSFGERVAMNSAIQGTAADIIKIAMIRVSKRLRQEGLESKLILQIHDELLIEAKIGEEDKIRQILTEEMMGAASLQVPLVIDIQQGHNWFEAK